MAATRRGDLRTAARTWAGTVGVVGLSRAIRRRSLSRRRSPSAHRHQPRRRSTLLTDRLLKPCCCCGSSACLSGGFWDCTYTSWTMSRGCCILQHKKNLNIASSPRRTATFVTPYTMDQREKPVLDTMTATTPQENRPNVDTEKCLRPATVDDNMSPGTQPELVEWDGPDDPEMPLNWPKSTRWFNVLLVACITFLTSVSLMQSRVHFFMANLGVTAVQPLRVVHVRTRHRSSHGGDGHHKPGYRLLRCLYLPPRIRLWAPRSGTLQRIIRPTSCIPYLHSLVPYHEHVLWTRDQHADAYRLSPPDRTCRCLPDDHRPGYRVRSVPATRKRSGHGCLHDAGALWAVRRPCRRSLCFSGLGLAVDLLAAYNHGKYTSRTIGVLF